MRIPADYVSALCMLAKIIIVMPGLTQILVKHVQTVNQHCNYIRGEGPTLLNIAKKTLDEIKHINMAYKHKYCPESLHITLMVDST